jgi:hypothetical protein
MLESVKIYLTEVILKKALPLAIQGGVAWIASHQVLAPLLTWIDKVADPLLAKVGITVTVGIDWTKLQAGLTVLSLGAVGVLQHHLEAWWNKSPHSGASLPTSLGK